MTPVFMAHRLGVALLLATACLASASTLAQTREQIQQIRMICNDPALQQRLVARAQQAGKLEEVEQELEERCAQIDLPSTPVHDAADPSPAAAHSDWVFDARYSRDGRTIVSGSRDGTVRVWDAETGRTIRRIVVGEPAKDRQNKGIIRHVTLVGDGTRAAAASDRNPVTLVELATGKIVGSFPVAGDSFGGSIAATTGGLLFIGGYTDSVDAIDTKAQAVRYRLPGHQMEGSAIAVSETAGLVATAASSRYSKPEGQQVPRVLLWRLDTGERLAAFEPKGDDRADALAFSRDGTQLAVAIGVLVHVYSVAERRVTQTLRLPSGPFGVAFTADGKGLLTCTRLPILWDVATGKKLRHFGPFSDLCHSVDVSPDGRFAVTTSMGSDVRVWEIATGTFHRRLGASVAIRR